MPIVRAKGVPLDSLQTLYEERLGHWLWRGPKHRRYCIGLANLGGHRYIPAHRFIWELVHGPLAHGQYLPATCKLPFCVNPEHRRLTTFPHLPDGRAGEHAPHAKLNWEKVHAIRAGHSAGESYVTLAKLYGVSVGCISGILSGRNWKEPIKDQLVSRHVSELS